MRTATAIALVALSSAATAALGQTIPDPAVMGPALAANVHGSYSSVSTPNDGRVVNAPVTGNGDLGVMIGGPSTSLNFAVGKADFWGVEHGVIMPVGRLVLSAPALSGSSYSLVENVGAATITGSFTAGNSGLGLNTWVATSQNTAFIQLTNTGSAALTFTSQLQDAYGTVGNPGTLGYSSNATWLNVSPDAVYLELGNHLNIGSSAPLTGRIADMQIFNQALTPAQLNALETPAAVPCVLQWTATNQGAASLRGTASLNITDPHGGSMVLTGDANSEVAVGVMGLPQRQFTVAAWVYLTAVNPGSESCIFAGLVNHGTGGYPFLRGLKLVATAGGALSATLNSSGSAGASPTSLFSADSVNAYTATASGALPLNQWIQAAVTYDGYSLTIYTNGMAVGMTTNFPSAALVNGYNKTAIHLGDTNAEFNGCAPQGVLMQSVFGVPVSDNGSTLTFTVPAGGQATIALAAVTDRNTNNFLAAAQQQSQQASVPTMNGLFQEHNQWWSNFWAKSFVQIPDQQIQNEWYASLYLLACCSKSNCPPPGLWGNFISSPGMWWEGDYTLDYNYQATFWIALACNHPELAENYDGLLLDHIARGQATAQHWGYQGIYLYTHLIPFPGWSDDGYTFWSQKSDAIFAAVNCAMRWRYTHDTNYAARIYPYMKGVADFWTNYLVLSNNVAYWDYNDAAGESGSTSDVNPATSLAFIQLVFPALNEMSQALNLDAGSRPLWSNIIQKLSPLPIVPAASISSLSALGPNYVTPGMNVIRDTASGTAFPTPEVANYLSRLQTPNSQENGLGSSPGMNSSQVIFPGWNIGLESDPATLAAASNTVYLAAEWCDGNDCCTFYPSAAAIGYNPRQIMANLDLLIRNFAFPNFMFAFGGGGTEDYSIVPCCLANMFLQSHQTNLHIFPNWPVTQNAAFGNLNACGGFLVSSAQTNGSIPYVQIASTAGQRLKLANPWPQMTVQVASTVNPTTTATGNIIAYQTQAGEVVTLTPVSPAVAAPPAPAWLGATPGSGQITLNWYQSVGASSYDVWRSTDGTNYVLISTNQSAMTFTDTNLSYGTVYYYEVSAVNGFGQSANSASASTTPLPSITTTGMVVLDDDFNDAGGNLVLNTAGIGNGFTSFTASAGTVVETNSSVQLASTVNGADRAVIDSVDAIPVNAGGTLYEFRGVSFTNRVSNTGTGTTDRLLLGVQNSGAAGDWIESGPAAMPSGFWIQFNSDSEAIGTGNGAWADGTSTLFYKDPSGNRTELASWQFDNLRWGPSGPVNYAPVLDVRLMLSANLWALTITGDTQGGGQPIMFSGTYSGSGINNALLNGLNNVYAGAEDQTEAPGIVLSMDRVIVKQLGSLIVPTPMFSTPQNANNTNRVYAGATVMLSSAVTDSVATPTLQWQLEDKSHPGTFTNLPVGNATTVAINTAGLGDSLPRGVRLVASDGSNSLTSVVVTLTVSPLPTPSPVGRWLGGAMTYADVSGYSPAGAHDGWLISGSAYWTNDVPSNAPPGSFSLHFNNAGLAISNSSTLDPAYTSTYDDAIANSFTVMCWAKGWPGQWNPWVSKYGDSGIAPTCGWQLRQNGNNQNYACWTIRGAGGTVTLGTAVYGNPEDMATTTINSNDGKWHHYAGTYDAVTGVRNLYVDGMLAAAETGNGPFTLSAPEHLCIGARDQPPGNNFTGYFTGNIYDVRIYSYALNQAQVKIAARLTAPQLNPPVALNGHQVVLSWPLGTLDQATNLSGPWTILTNATSPYTNDLQWPQQFFRISNP